MRFLIGIVLFLSIFAWYISLFITESQTGCMPSYMYRHELIHKKCLKLQKERLERLKEEFK